MSACAADQVREYQCDDLLPLLSSRPAPAPYGNCPGAIDVPDSRFAPVSDIASFDAPFTTYTRERISHRDGTSAGGHTCCYGWCTRAPLARAELAPAPVACTGAYTLREGFVMRETESGTSAPAASPYERCPVALKPPERVSFAAPAAALLDIQCTAQQRTLTRLNVCAYAWCSKAPPGTVLSVTRKEECPSH